MLETGQASEKDEIAQGLFQLSFDSLEGWGFHSFSRQPVLPYSKAFFCACVHISREWGLQEEKGAHAFVYLFMNSVHRRAVPNSVSSLAGEESMLPLVSQAVTRQLLK